MESQTAVVNERYQVALDRVRVTTLTEDLPASDLLLDRDVVFRALKGQLTADRTFVDRFRKQVQSAANLTHPNIVSVYDWGRERDGFGDRPGPVYFVITERNTGRSVWSYVNEKGPLPIERVVHILLGVTSAMGYAHRSGTLHGGLRPELVSVSPTGLVKVSDFGFLGAVDAISSLPGTTVSDVQWLAPELASGDPADQRTDVYGIGQLCYFLTTARVPFTGNDVDEVLRKQKTGVPPAPRKIRPELPRALEVIIGRCLAKRPDDRFATVNEVRSALVRLQESLGGPVTGSPTIEPTTSRSGAASKSAGEVKQRTIADFGEPVGPEEPTRIDIPPTRPAGPPNGIGRPAVVARTIDSPGDSATAPDSATFPNPSPAGISGTTSGAASPWAGAGITDATALTPLADRPESFPTTGKSPSTGKSPAEEKPAASAPAKPTVKTPIATSAARPPTFEADDSANFDLDATTVAARPPKPNTIGGDGVDGVDATMVTATRKRPSFIGWLVLAGMVAILGGMLALLAQTLNNSRSETVTVSNVIGKSTDAATAELTGLGLRVQTRYETNPDVSREVVFGQEPGPNTEVKSGSSVTLNISSGDGILRVPDVVGQSEAVAKATLQTKQFKVAVETRPDDNTAPGNVIQQNPPSDSEAQVGDTITIIVATRTGKGKVPDVSGKTPEDAIAALTAEGFRSVVRDEASTTIEKGLVSRTDPVAGKVLERNGTVIVFVSRGPAVDVPSVIGQVEAAAIQNLRALGFVVDRQTKLVPSPAEVGVVLEQTPQGEKAVFGSTVSIVVGELDPNPATTIPEEDGGRATVVTTTVPTIPPTVPPAPPSEVTTLPATAPPSVVVPETIPATPAPTAPTPAPELPVPVPAGTPVPAPAVA